MGAGDSSEMQELADGVAFWRSRPRWPADFHNSDYVTWATASPNGNFTLAWWNGFLPILQAWIATRPYSGAILTARMKAHANALKIAWQIGCVPVLDRDISSVSWDQVRVFPNEVGKIKPTRFPSPVFTSKFCHFLLPKVFPVVDNAALGGKWVTYESYFKLVQTMWAQTPPKTQAKLIQELERLIQLTGQNVFAGFPMANKIVELRLIGRQHPSGVHAVSVHARKAGQLAGGARP